jgi:hypothetical protein
MTRSVFVLLCLIVIGGIFPARADVTVVQALHFGSFISKNNDAQYDITIHPGGAYSFSGTGFIEILPPQQGIYDIDGLPASSTISSIIITQLSPLASNSGENFQMLDFEETHGNSNGSGVARVNIGATARTTGSGIAYPDQTYTGELQIQINF